MLSLDVGSLLAQFQIINNIHLHLAIVFITYSEVVLSQILHLLSLYAKCLFFQGFVERSLLFITTQSCLNFQIGRGDGLLGFIEKIRSYLGA